MFKKVTNQRIQQIDGKPCLVLTGEDGSELYFPAMGMQSIFDNAMQQYNAYSAQHGISAGQWKPAIIVTPQTWNTGITDAGMVGVVVDRGMSSEQTFALLPEHADGLGRQLVKTAKRAPSQVAKN